MKTNNTLIDDFQLKLVEDLRSNEQYQWASIYTILLELCMNNDINHVLDIMHDVSIDLQKRIEFEDNFKKLKAKKR